jgi:hypothetical protein
MHRPDNDLQGVEAFLEHYSITERGTAEAAMQDAARRALSQYCSLFSGVADDLDLKYYCWGRASVRRRSHTKKQLRPKSFLRDGRRSLFMELRRFKPT